MTDPFQELMDEHRVIEKVLTAMEAGANQDLGREFYAKALAFLTAFADGCHHGKEEEHLFPMLERRGMPRDMGPIGVMEEEHEQARRHIARIRELMDGEDDAALRLETLAYTALMRGHIEKEDEVLFPMGSQLLTTEDRAELRTQFDRVGTHGGCSDVFASLADELLKAANVPV